MKLYRYSPITTTERAHEALSYVHAELSKLSRMVLGVELPIESLKLFAHYDDEYEFLEQWLSELGEDYGQASTTSRYVTPRQPLRINGEQIKLVGIRRPDPYRSQVGCGDVAVADYASFKVDQAANSYVREVEHPKLEMLEFFHPDSDVLGYVVND